MDELVAGHAVQIEESTDTHRVAAWRNLAMVFVYDGSHDDLRHIVAVSRVIERLGKSGPVCVLGVLPEQGRPPSQRVRDAFMGIGKRFGSRLDRVAFVVPGVGFGAAAHRAAVNGLIMLLRPVVPVRIESSVDDALAFLVDADPAARAGLAALVTRQISAPARPG